MADAQPRPRRLVCARCGAAFDCGLGGDCWCSTEPYRLPMPPLQSEDCLCPACLRKAADAVKDSRDAASG
ncbi:MAG TPA: cysteine-rich CWC family protein [Pseudolabrys sp.]|nr:cysteine-rich CWC family protein [Pseudolabrys sp.]